MDMVFQTSDVRIQLKTFSLAQVVQAALAVESVYPLLETKGNVIPPEEDYYTYLEVPHSFMSMKFSFTRKDGVHVNVFVGTVDDIEGQGAVPLTLKKEDIHGNRVTLSDDYGFHKILIKETVESTLFGGWYKDTYLLDGEEVQESPDLPLMEIWAKAIKAFLEGPGKIMKSDDYDWGHFQFGSIWWKYYPLKLRFSTRSVHVPALPPLMAMVLEEKEPVSSLIRLQRAWGLPLRVLYPEDKEVLQKTNETLNKALPQDKGTPALSLHHKKLDFVLNMGGSFLS